MHWAALSIRALRTAHPEVWCRIFVRIVKWLGGLSLSSVILLLILILTVLVLRRKGYAVRLGFGCLIFRAKSGSRRFPQGCEVRVSSRLVGYFFGGCRGPWLDIYADRFCMRLRAGTSAPPPRRWYRSYRVYSAYLAIDRGYWRTLLHNVLSRIIAFVVRGLRIRASKVRIWKDLSSWEFSADTLVLAGGAEGLFGSRYTMSLNELNLSLRTEPAQGSSAPVLETSIVSRRGVEITAHLSPRLFSLLLERRMAIFDDVRLAIDMKDFVCKSGDVLFASLKSAAVELSPRHSHKLRDKLPVHPALNSRNTRNPGLIRRWEASAEVNHVAIRFAPPSRPAPEDSALPSWHASSSHLDLEECLRVLHVPGYADSWLYSNTRIPSPPHVGTEGSPNISNSGFFFRLDTARAEAYGVAADERQEAVTHASAHIRGCSAGSLAIDDLSRDLYEKNSVPSVECIEPHPRRRRARMRRLRNSSRTAGNAAKQKNPAEDPSSGEHHRTSRVMADNSMDHLEKIVAARPEAMLWIDEINSVLDSNLRTANTSRVDIAGYGLVCAFEPIGLASLFADSRAFFELYATRNSSQTTSASASSDAMASLIRSASSSSLGSYDGEGRNFQAVCDLRHCRSILLGHGPVGDGDTIAVILSTDSVSMPSLEHNGMRGLKFDTEASNLKFMHWTPWARTTNIVCETARLQVGDLTDPRRRLSFKSLDVDWDLDLHSAFLAIPQMLSIMKHFAKSHEARLQSATELIDNGSQMETRDSPVFSDNDDSCPESSHVSENGFWSEEERLHKEKVLHMARRISGWDVSGSEISVAVSFPDGPRLAVKIGALPECALSATSYFGRDVVLTIYNSPCIYAATFQILNPLFTVGRSVRRPKIDIKAQGIRGVLQNNFELGSVLQDWFLRFRALLKVLRDQRFKNQGIAHAQQKRTPVPDIFFRSSDVVFYLEDQPLAEFWTKMLPLFQDESRERELRHAHMARRVEQLQKISRAELAGTAARCLRELEKLDSEIWVARVKALRKAIPPFEVAAGFLPPLSGFPLATLFLKTLNFEMVMDEETRHAGSKESLRKLRLLDEYELGPMKEKKRRQYDRDAWNSIGFRNIGLEISQLQLSFRDYPDVFLEMDKACFEKTVIGQAVQATMPPYISETKVAVGRRRVMKLVKGLGSTKLFADIHLAVDTLTCRFNPALFGVIGDFCRGMGRLFGSGRNPSPRIPWFDILRVNTHGRMRITAKKFKGYLAYSSSQYTKSRHYVEIDCDQFTMLGSRLKPTPQDPFPIMWELHNWHIMPSTFNSNFASDIGFDFVRVGLIPKPECNSGDAQDHYFMPFPTKEEVKIGCPSIGKGAMELLHVREPVEAQMNPLRFFTTWTTGLGDLPGHDSYAGFKTRRMVLGINACVRHPKSLQPGMGCRSNDPIPIVEDRRLHYIPAEPSKDEEYLFWAPRGASLLYSDALTTLIKVIKNLVHRPISCRLAPRFVDPARKLPSKTGMSSSLVKLDVKLDVSDLNVMFYNNLQPGHGLFVSVSRMSGELVKETDISYDEIGNLLRQSKLTRRKVEVRNLNSSIRSRDLDLAADRTGTGRLLSVSRIFLSDDVNDEPEYAASSSLKAPCRVLSTGFGSCDEDKSPFYTFSASHSLQREKKIDKVQHDVRIAVDDVRLLWSPARRTSIWAWSDAFKEKTFAMKAPPVEVELWSVGCASKNSVNESSARKDVRLESGLDMSIKPRSKSAEPLNDTSDGEFLVGSHSPSQSSPAVLPSGQKLGPSLPLSEARMSQDSDIGTKARLQPMLSSRSKSTPVRRPEGSMIDILQSDDDKVKWALGTKEASSQIVRTSVNSRKVLQTVPKFELLVNSFQICIGSPETTGLVFLTSEAARIGIVEKTIQNVQQIGGQSDTYVDREHRVHLKESNIYCQSTALDKFDFGATAWVPKAANRQSAKCLAPLARVSTKPLSMDLMYISSTSIVDGEDDDVEDHSLRPSLLFINLPDIAMASTSVEFHAVVDVVRKVLMQRAASSGTVKQELAQLRYNLQLAGNRITTRQLDEYMRRLNCIVRQFLYAGDTFQPELVGNLLLPDEDSFNASLQRYKAKAKAVGTFIRTDQRASTTDFQYPTMYISYSFDKCSWELRELNETSCEQTPFVEITLSHLVCRHIFYVGRGSSAEVTFENIRANNKMHRSYFDDFLKPARSDTGMRADGRQKISSIKASDGSPVAFRWYSTQTDRVGGITVYDLLTIQVAPLNAAVSRKLYSTVYEFIFSVRKSSSESAAASSTFPASSSKSQLDAIPSTVSSARSSSDGREIRKRHSSSALSDVSRQSSFSKDRGPGSSASSLVPGSRMADVTQMTQRGESTMLFKYVFIDAFELTASYKNKEKDRSVLDFSNLFVTTPSFSYSSEVWTWKDFATRIKRDLVYTFARRGVSKLAKIKLLPGYNRARRKLFQEAENIRESISSRLNVSYERDPVSDDDEEFGHDSDDENDSEGASLSDSSGEIEEQFARAYDVRGRGRSDDSRRKAVLKALYGSRSLPFSKDISNTDPQISRDVSARALDSNDFAVLLSRRVTEVGAETIHMAAGVTRPPLPTSRPYRGSSFHMSGNDFDSSTTDRNTKQSIWGRLRRRQ